MSDAILIVGGGPAGLAAALQLKRQGREARVFEACELGGLLRNAHRVENYLGFPRGIGGPDLVRRFRRQAETWGLQVEHTRVLSLAYDEGTRTFAATPENGPVRHGAVAVVASGTRPLRLPLVESLPRRLRDRVSYEVSSLMEMRNRDIVVVGSGDAAHDYALNLAQRNRVALWMRGGASGALPLLQRRVARHPRIEVQRHTVLTGVTGGEDRPLSLAFIRGETPGVQACDHLVCAVGREPETSFYDAFLAGAEADLVAAGRLHTVGDVRNGSLRQAAIATGDGIAAAMAIDRFLDGGGR